MRACGHALRRLQAEGDNLWPVREEDRRHGNADLRRRRCKLVFPSPVGRRAEIIERLSSGGRWMGSARDIGPRGDSVRALLQTCASAVAIMAAQVSAAPFAYIANSGSNTVSVIDI